MRSSGCFASTAIFASPAISASTSILASTSTGRGRGGDDLRAAGAPARSDASGKPWVVVVSGVPRFDGRAGFSGSGGAGQNELVLLRSRRGVSGTPGAGNTSLPGNARGAGRGTTRRAWRMPELGASDTGPSAVPSSRSIALA